MAANIATDRAIGGAGRRPDAMIGAGVGNPPARSHHVARNRPPDPMSALDGVRALLVDLDGVLYVEDAPVPGAVDAVAALRGGGVGLRFVTNTTQRSRAHTLDKLERLGFGVADEELITPAVLAVEHCRGRGHERVALLMADDVKADLSGLTEADEGDDAVDAVIVGDLGERFDYAVLNRAFRRLLDGAELVALQRNRYWLRGDGLALDVGPFVAALEYAANVEAVVVGKPAAAFFTLAVGQLGAQPAEAAMVGDDVESDVAGALRAGLRGVLVRTGKYRDETARAADPPPTATVASIADVPALLGL
jgi:HAD superfamily hydrolase (TIGR01458 family)